MSFLSQVVRVTLEWGKPIVPGEGPPPPEVTEAQFTGEPITPINDDERAGAQWSAIDKARAWLGSMYPPNAPPEHEPREEVSGGSEPVDAIADLQARVAALEAARRPA